MRRRDAGIVIACAVALSVLSARPANAGTTGAVHGTVRDALGQPLTGVSVSIAAPSYSATTTTGANGFYAFNGMPVDTYRVTFSKDGYVPQIIPATTVLQDQNVRVDGKLLLSIKTIATISVRGSTSLVQPTVTADTYSVSQRALQNITGTPQDPNGFAVLNSLPGVTTDNFGVPTIRAGMENDVGYEYEGVDNTDPVLGEYLNSMSLNGARSIQLSTGGYDVSSGNTNSGVINQVVKRGSAPGSGEATVRLFAPAFGHELSMDWGDATPDNSFSYYVSFGLQRDATSYGNGYSYLPLMINQGTFATIDDDVLNVYYRFGRGHANEVQFVTDITHGDYLFGYGVAPKQAPYASKNGNVRVGSEVFNLKGNPLLDQFGDPITLADFITLYPGQVASDQNIGLLDTQDYNSTIDKLNFKRQLSASSFAELRAYKILENWINRYPYNLGSFTDEYEDINTHGLGLGFDFNTQLSSKHALGFGADETVYISNVVDSFPSFEPFNQPLEAIGCRRLSGLDGNGGCYISTLNAVIDAAHPLYGLPTDAAHAPMKTFANDGYRVDDPVHRSDIYLKDLYQPNERLTIDVGLRFDRQVYDLPANASALDVSYFIDDAGDYVTVPGPVIGPDVTRPSQVSPRFAASYKLDDADVVRFSYGKNIEFEPEFGIEGSYRIDPSLARCSITSGCFQPLQGFGVTNHISNLYQQIIADENTNNFQQYTPVRPQRAVNIDMSLEHDFGAGVQLKISPYYRKGTDYIVSSSKLLFTLPSGTPVFGPSHASNAGINENTGFEFDLEDNRPTDLSGFLNVTYDNTLANYDSDFFPSVNDAALAAGHFFHVSYVAPITGSLNLAYDTPKGFHVSMNMPFESGYRYGVGTKTWVFEQLTPGGPNVPVEVLNTDLAANTPQQAYYFTDPSNPGTIDHPNITGSRGTPDGSDPGTLHGFPSAVVNLTISHDYGHGDHHYSGGIRIQNVFGNYTPASPVGNPYYVNNGLGGYGPTSGQNTNAPFEPFQHNFSPFPYENEPTGFARSVTLYVSASY